MKSAETVGRSGAAEINPEELITNDQAAKLLGIEPATLVTWRSEKRGPDYLKVGRLVYYRRSDINAWLATCLRRARAA